MNFRTGMRAMARCVLYAALSVSALGRGLEGSQFTFVQIPSPNFGRVNAIVRDDRGFLWFGTTKGLFKYDGYRVRVFPGSSPESGLVFAMVWAGDGSLVLGTGNGLWKFDPRSENAEPYLNGMPFSGTRIISLTKDPAGRLWIGTSTRGLFCYQPKSQSVQYYGTENGLSDNRITVLLPGRNNMMWVGTGNGGLNAIEYKTSHIVTYRRNMSPAGSLSSDHITSLCQRGDRELWIGTDDGLNILDIASQTVRGLKIHSPIKHTIMSIANDPSGRMWIAATDLGLLSFAEGTFTPFPTADDAGRSLNTILTVYPDPVASSAARLLLWVGTHSGVDKIVILSNPFENHVRGEQSLRLDRGAVLSLCEDRNSILWVGLWGGGLDALRRVGEGYQRVGHYDNQSTGAFRLPANDVGSILEDGTGNLWVGTQEGLAMFTADRKRLVIDRHAREDSMSLAGNEVGRIYEDHSGRIWVCTTAGLSLLLPGTAHRFKNYLDRQHSGYPASPDEVSDIFEDSLGKLWIATSGNGLIELEPDGAMKRYRFPGDSTGTRENWLYAIAPDRKGVCWLSTRGGLVSFDPRTHAFRQLDIETLSDEHIFGIAIDHNNNLWLSTSIGLAKFNPQTTTLVKYEQDDGLLFGELRSRFFQNAKGRLFVGGLDGFVEFLPESVSAPRHPPPVVITGFSIFDKTMPASVFGASAIQLTHDQKSFAFSFAALDYTDPQRNSYAYRMVGLDEEWVNAGHRTYASYTNIEPGFYTFQVKGANSDDVWNEAGASVRILISPPYWETWWFRIGLAVLVITATYFAYRYRVGRLLEMERLRLRIANDLHDDVGSNLSAIAMVSRALQRVPELSDATRRRVTEIYDTAVFTSAGMRDLVWLIKPENDTLDDLLLRMKDTASALLGEIPFTFHSPDTLESEAIALDFKRSVFLAFKEIIANVAKHSNATMVEIRVRLQDRRFEMVVSDNGRGFDPAGPHHGNGLQSLRKRAEHIDGSCLLESAVGRGTVVTFAAPMS